MHYYFAYGSNMLPAQMADRCPGAQAVGPAMLPGWRFHITTRGSASIVQRRDGMVHGVLWRCNPAHFHSLDRFEGVHWGNYRRRLVMLEDHPERSLPVVTYVNGKTYPGRARPNYLLTAVIPGARAFGLPHDYIAELESWLPRRIVADLGRRHRGRTKPVRFPR